MKKYLALLVIALLIFGCTGGGQQPPTPQPNQTPTPPTPTPPAPTPKPSPFPMRITYTIGQASPNGGSQAYEIIYYLEADKKCDSRDAVVGVYTARQVGATGSQPYGKITVYLDNGEFVNSNFQSEGDLAFDTAKAQAPDMDFMLLMNYIFKNAGRNFMNDEIWNSTEPVILKDVVIFSGVANISVTKVGESTSGVVPCTEFNVATKERSGSAGQLKVCVAKLSDTNPLPYVVYARPNEAGQGPSWDLESVDKMKSNITEYPQCLSPVVCPKFTQPTQQEFDTCNMNGSMEAIKNENNCVTGYRCLTLKERAEEQLTGSMAPRCPLPQQLIDDLAACWEQQKNADFSRDNSGCITAVTCP